MDLQNLDPNLLVFGGLGCVALCGIGIVLFFGMQAIGAAVGTFAGLFDIFGQILGGGPISWCGCAAVIVGIVACVGVVLLAGSALSTCGTPDAMNICTFFGR